MDVISQPQTASAPSRPTLPRVVPVTSVMGAEIEGVNLSQPIGDAAFAAIRDAFVAHHLLAFSGQKLEPAHIRAFAERFGAIEGNSIKGHDGRVLDPVRDRAVQATRRPAPEVVLLEPVRPERVLEMSRRMVA